MQKTFVPIFIKVSDVARVPEGTYKRGKISDIAFEDLTATDCYSYTRSGEIPSVIWGKPDSPIEDIHFENVSITAKGGNPVANSRINPTENDQRFPTDIGALPAHAWYLSHVRNIGFIDCDFRVEKSDGKPAFVINNASKLLFDNTTLPVGSECSARISLRGTETQNLTIQNCVGMGNRKLKSVTDSDF